MSENNMNLPQPPESMVQALKANLEVYPVDFNPLDYLTLVTQEADSTPLFILPVSIKRLWFYAFCRKNGNSGQILPDCDIRYDMPAVDGRPAGYALARCAVIIDGVTVATAQVGQHFYLDKVVDMDSVVQYATGLAQSKALTNAGFGVVSTSGLDDPGLLPIPAGIPQQSGNEPVMNTVPAAAPYGPGAPVAPAVSANPADPEARKQAAKAVKWMGNGQYQGKTLGEILATSPRGIIYAVERLGDSPLREAAKVLYPDACKAVGQPCKI